MTIIIIGGVAGGASAAARARRHSESARIIVIERGYDVSFANCGLPYHLGGEIPDRADLAVQTPESLKKLLNLDVRTRTEALTIDRSNKSVLIKNLETGSEESLTYDKLVLAPGATPLRPPLSGIDLPGIHTLRTLQDMDRIGDDMAKAKSALVVGAGFIGLEMAEQMRHKGLDVTLVELVPQVLAPMDPELARHLERELTSHGITVHTGEQVVSFEQKDGAILSTFKSEKTVLTDLVILSIGVRPESELAAAAGLNLGPRGHIQVNPHQQTNDPDIYAAGDAVETHDPLLNELRPLPLGGPANRQGRTIADHIFMGDKALPYPGSLGTAIVRVFDLAAAVTGHGEKYLKHREVPYQTVTINADSHAGYYPGAETITLKILWSPDTGKLLGAQAVGKVGIDKRIDILATALRADMTIDDLCHLELTYAPPFGSAKDPVNIAGFAACNMRDGALSPIYEIPSNGEQIIDVRPAAKAESQPVPGARNIPLPTLRDRLDELDKSQPVYTICQMGKTSYFAARILQNNGFDARSILGGAHSQL